jgi:CBFA2/RNUX1 translocation partner 1
LTVEDFQIAVQEATNFPLRPNILPFLKSHIPTLQRDISVAARATKQTPIQFVRTNESAVLEFVHNPTEHTEFFFHEGSFSTPATASGGTALTAPLLAKRRASDMYEHANGSTGGTASTYEWDYLLPPSKRASVHSMFLTGSSVGTSSAVAAAAAAAQHLYAGHPSFLDYQNGLQSSHSELLVRVVVSLPPA